MTDAELDGSVTCWLERLKAGDLEAVGPLWGRYFARLVALARTQLSLASRAAADAEDVALSAFASFCRGVESGRFPKLDDRDDLWRLLLVLTSRKSVDLARHAGRAKRGGGRTIGDSDALALVAGTEPTPAFAAEVADECRRLLSLLGEGELRQLAIWKMDGHTNAEIAALWGRSVPTVERKLARIRTLWQRETPT